MAVDQIFPGVYRIGGRLATKNFAPGKEVYGEKLVKIGSSEYRLWEPSRSKLGAAIAKGLRNMAIAPGSKVLYLGAANGTTSSHVSDIVGAKGEVICVEFSPRSMRDLIFVCETRKNMLPVLADARMPEAYAEACGGKADVVFEDVADPAQAEILKRNCKLLLKPDGIAMIAVKSQSISSTRDPKEVYAEVEGELSDDFETIERLHLEPFEEDHIFLVLKPKA